MNRFLLIIIILFTLNGCLYSPILSNKKYDFQFLKINSQGEKNINEIITNNLIRTGNGNKMYDINFFSKKVKEVISTNEKGDPTAFRIRITINYKLLEDNTILIKNDISKKITYNNISDKLELIKYEENLINNLASNISAEMLMSIASLGK